MSPSTITENVIWRICRNTVWNVDTKAKEPVVQCKKLKYCVSLCCYLGIFMMKQRIYTPKI